MFSMLTLFCQTSTICKTSYLTSTRTLPASTIVSTTTVPAATITSYQTGKFPSHELGGVGNVGSRESFQLLCSASVAVVRCNSPAARAMELKPCTQASSNARRIPSPFATPQTIHLIKADHFSVTTAITTTTTSTQAPTTYTEVSTITQAPSKTTSTAYQTVTNEITETTTSTLAPSTVYSTQYSTVSTEITETVRQFSAIKPWMKKMAQARFFSRRSLSARVLFVWTFADQTTNSKPRPSLHQRSA